MPNTEKTFNLNYLTAHTGIDINEGMERNKQSLHDYFKTLSKFESDTKEIMNSVFGKRNKAASISDLSLLKRKLFKIGDTAIIPKVELLIMMTRRNAPAHTVIEKMHEVRSDVKTLIAHIKKAGADSGEASSSVSAKPAEDQRPPVNPELFAELIAMIDDYDYSGAEKAARDLLTMRLEPYMEWFLKKSIDRFEQADLDGARDAINELLLAVGKREDDLKRESAKNAKTGAKKRVKAEIKPRIGDKPIILAIDDVPDVLAGIKEMLKGRYKVYCVTNYLAALKFITADTPDLILLDIDMPEIDGFELLKRLRQMHACKNTPVIFLTGNVSIENVKTSIESGGNDFVKKPVDVRLLIEKIEKHMS